jgi:hypothetical protein
MDKNNNTFIYYYVEDLFRQNNYSAIDELELWNSLLNDPKENLPGRAPSLNNNQNGI